MALLAFFDALIQQHPGLPGCLDRSRPQGVHEDERELLCLIDALVDEAWRLPVGKDRGRLTAKTLRGELRRAFTSHGRSERRFYTAFYDIEKRVFT